MTLPQLKALIADASGADAVGVAAARPVDDDADALFRRWIADGCHGEMSYLERYGDVRRDPRLLLDGAKTLIMTAFSYANPEAVDTMRRNKAPRIAEYALADDYHTVLRRRLGMAAEALTRAAGGTTRVCVDTAPLRERYWAWQAGIGFLGTNNYLIIPGLGAHFYLGTILWTGRPDGEYDAPCSLSCGNCNACVAACPGKAINADGRLDARRCLSYLTIESRQPVPDDIHLGGRLFGCDTCRKVCPHQPYTTQPTHIPEFVARPLVVALTRNDWQNMTPERFNNLFRNSALRRTKLSRLQEILLKN